MQINSVGYHPGFNATIKAKNVNVYDMNSKKFIGSLSDFTINTAKIDSVVDKVKGLNPDFTKGITTFLISNDKQQKIFGIPSLYSFEDNKKLIDECAKEENRFNIYQIA